MSQPAQNLLEFQPLLLSLSPSLISNNISFPICHVYLNSLVFTPTHFQNPLGIENGEMYISNKDTFSGDMHNRDSRINSSGEIYPGMLSGGLIQNDDPVIISLNRKINAFESFIMRHQNSQQKRKIQDNLIQGTLRNFISLNDESTHAMQSFMHAFLQDGYIAIALENGLSIWEKSTEKFIFNFEYENDDEYSNHLEVSDDATSIILASNQGCYHFQCFGKRVELRKSISCFGSSVPVNILRVAFSTNSVDLSPESNQNTKELNETKESLSQSNISSSVHKNLWIADQEGRIQCLNLNTEKEIVSLDAFTYYKGILQSKYGKSSNSAMDSLSTSPIEIQGYLLCPYHSGIIRVFDIKSRHMVASINAHIGSIRAFTLHPQGYKNQQFLILSAGEDQHVLIWEFGFDPLSLRLAYKFSVKDGIITGGIWLSDRLIGVTAFERKSLILLGIP